MTEPEPGGETAAWRGITLFVSGVVAVGCLLSGVVNSRPDHIVLAVVIAVLIAVNVTREADRG